jgi:hypothetical protein
MIGTCDDALRRLAVLAVQNALSGRRTADRREWAPRATDRGFHRDRKDLSGR